MSDAIRDQLIELGRQAPDGCKHGPNVWCSCRVAWYIDAMLALRDSDGIPLVLGLIADEVNVDRDGIVCSVETGSELPEQGWLRLFVPRLSEDKP